MTAQEKVELMLMMSEPPKRVKVSDLPGAPDKNTVYILVQEWVYLEEKWVRMG